MLQLSVEQCNVSDVYLSILSLSSRFLFDSTYKHFTFLYLTALYTATCAYQVVDVFSMSNIEFGTGLFWLFFGLGLCALNPVAGRIDLSLF